MRLRHPARTLGIAAGCLVLGGVLLSLPHSFYFESPGDGSSTGGGGLQRWACPMLCVVVDHPGRCPVCGMELEPIQSDGETVVVGRTERELIGLTLAPVGMHVLSRTESFPGTVVEAEPSQAVVTAWTNGRIDDFPAPPTGSRIRAGQAVASIYSPDLIQAQQELLIERARAGSDGDGMVEAARTRLREMGAGDRFIDQVEQSGTPLADVTVISAYSGTVLDRLVQDGDWVMKGQPILRIADLRTVWVEARLLEGQQGLLAVGDTVTVYPTGHHTGGSPAVVEQVEPYLDPATRSFAARVSLDNAGSSWLPGELALVEATVPEAGRGTAREPVLAVPASSVLSLGTRDIVYVEDVAATDSASSLPAETRGLFLRPRLVEVGSVSYDEQGERYRKVISGLSGGEQVALEGAFLLDSQAELTGLESLLNQAPSADSASSPQTAGSDGAMNMDMPEM